MNQLPIGLGKPEIVRSVLHIGAGYGDALDSYVRSGVETITLVEPNPELAADLRRKAAQLPNVTVISAAAGMDAGRATLNVYNLSELSSLRTATGAIDLLPSLQVIDKPVVEVLSFSAILMRHTMDVANANLLVIDAPGEEAVLLEQAIGSGAIEGFRQVTVYCGQQPLYEGCADAAHIIGLLEPLYFDLQEVAPDSLGRHCLQFRRNPAEALCRALEQEREDLKTRLAASEQDRRAREETITELSVEIKDLRAALTAKTEADEISKAHVAELSAALEQLKHELGQAKRNLVKGDKLRTELEYNLNAAKAQRDLCERELVKLEAQMELIRDMMRPPASDG